MLLASTGMRATEALSILNKNLDLESNPAKVTIRGEYTKTKVDRYFLTKEVVSQLKIWQNFKSRIRRICYKDPNGKNVTEYRTLEKNSNDLVFSANNVDNQPSNTIC